MAGAPALHADLVIFLPWTLLHWLYQAQEGVEESGDMDNTPAVSQFITLDSPQAADHHRLSLKSVDMAWTMH